MTTTPETPSAEQVIAEVLRPYLGNLTGPRVRISSVIAQVLRARGLLVGNPTEEQVERAAVAICVTQKHTGDRECENDYDAARAALAAAGVAPQERSEPHDAEERACGACFGSGELVAADGMYLGECKTCSGRGKFPQVTRNSHADTCISDECVQCKPAMGPSREKLIRDALERVREIGEAGLAGEPLSSIPKDVSSNWGWLQRQWPVVVAIDTALASQPVLDPEKVAEAIDRCGKWAEIEQLQITNYPNGWEATPAAQYIAGRLCEAAKRGELNG